MRWGGGWFRGRGSVCSNVRLIAGAASLAGRMGLNKTNDSNYPPLVKPSASSFIIYRNMQPGDPTAATGHQSHSPAVVQETKQKSHRSSSNHTGLMKPNCATSASRQHRLMTLLINKPPISLGLDRSTGFTDMKKVSFRQFGANFPPPNKTNQDVLNSLGALYFL